MLLLAIPHSKLWDRHQLSALASADPAGDFWSPTTQSPQSQPSAFKHPYMAQSAVQPCTLPFPTPNTRRVENTTMLKRPHRNGFRD